MALPQAAISVKLPSFWSFDPALWFAHGEAQFAANRITSDAAKLTHLIGALSPEIMMEVRDLIMAPPGSVSYDTFKNELIKRTSVSEQRRLHQLLISEELGDKTPSQLLRRMKQLLGDQTLPDGIFKQIFLKRLPANTQVILASTKESASVDELAEIADRIAETANPFSTIAPISSTNPFATSSDLSEMLEVRALLTQQAAQIQTLSAQLQELTCRSRSPHKNNQPRHFHRRQEKELGGLCCTSVEMSHH
ncbi:uncharacterized protein LOC128249782 [Octopus bimaculoides]|uniref:uncharacterized protein LOC128249782 n=1 Tax=Octopus bimaculoides TaxID=37653 RepID=UPI0022E5C18E|nr:uncharacterized protein LOC128249782 [Octopus bimaculoides]